MELCFKATPFAKADAFQRRLFGTRSIIASGEDEVEGIVIAQVESTGNEREIHLR